MKTREQLKEALKAVYNHESGAEAEIEQMFEGLFASLEFIAGLGTGTEDEMRETAQVCLGELQPFVVGVDCSPASGEVDAGR